ncbi:MAG: GNAT family N-acetyltransferase [Patescibacteria group bacterium]
MEIIQAIKSEEDIKKIAQVTAEHENFSPYSFDEIKRMIKRGQFFFAYDKEELVGFTAVTRLKKQWSELSLIYVFDRHRGKKIGSKLLEKVLEATRGQLFFAGSRSPILKGKLRRTGFKKIGLFILPLGLIFFLIKRQWGNRARFKDSWRKIKQRDFDFFVKNNQ